jgi:hypothetical protein
MSAVLPGGPATGAELGDRAAAIERAVVRSAPLSATERLVASRARLRSALMEIAHPPPRPSPFDGLSGLKAQIMDRLRAVPGADFAIETLEGWWAQHPLHAVGLVAEEVSRNFVLPVARTNPFGLIVGSLVVGALLVVSRPWRWLLKPALFVGLVPQLAAHALQRMPVDSWVQMLSSILPAKRAAKESAAAARASDLPTPP